MDKKYDVIQSNRRNGNAVANEYYNNPPGGGDSWGRQEVSVTDALPANLVDEHGGRRLDIAEVDPISPRGVEIKSGYTYLSDDIQSQIEADAYLIGSADPKWNIVWHFDGGPSAPLLKELNDRGIPWTIKDPNNLPSGYTP